MMMQIERELTKLTPPRETILALGVFDGVHMGHRYLLESLNRQARDRNLISGVVTFAPHPQWVLHPHNQLPCLSSLEDRIKKLREVGVSLVAVLSFTSELASLSAQEFIGLLRRYLKMRGLVIGSDFALGKGREGNIKLLSLLGQEMGFSVDVVSFFTVDGEIVSSTLIRQALAQGNMVKVGKLLGHYFYLEGRVVSEAKRGRSLGFPTANLAIKPDQALPANGVYVTITSVGKNKLSSVTNIGVRPTFGQNTRNVETYLVNYKGDLYDQVLKVEFIQKLRDEQHFASTEELKAQIKEDVEKVLKLFADRGNAFSEARNEK